MSNFPFSLDDDGSLPRVDANITTIGPDAINALRSAVFAIESDIGIGAAGSTQSIAQRLSTSLDPVGNIFPSVLIGLLSIVQITDAQVSPTAAIQESKLDLSYSTLSLYNLYITLKTSVDILNGFLSLTGVKLEPHIDGTNYNHLLSAILVDPSTSFYKISPSSLPSAGTHVVNRNTTNSDLLVKDISDDLVIHEKADNSSNVTANSGGTVPPANYAHNASGIYVNPSSFIEIPQSNNDVQKVIDYIDNSSLLLIGSRIQNFYSNGVAKTARSSSILADGYGAPIVPPTNVTAYHLGIPPGPIASSPIDSFSAGDDVILFNPTSSQLSTFNFDAQFAQVSAGDLLTINYGTGISYQFAVDSTKILVSGSIRTYAVRINGKNPVPDGYADGYVDGYAVARIDAATFNRNKYGVLAAARAPNNISAYESLIIVNPRSAVALGNGFNPTEFDNNHYNLYLTLLPNGDTTNIFTLPPIDVTGNKGSTPGVYTLDIIVNNINTIFRSPGYNYRFVAFEYKGQIGIALDPYNNASFSIVSGTVNNSGNYNSNSNLSNPANVIDNFNGTDPLGFGSRGANLASPPVHVSYGSIPAAMFAPTLLFYPLKRNYFYANGVERDLLNSDPLTINSIQDSNGNGYWPATITTVTIGVSTVSIVYTVNLDLSTSGIAVGKTLVVQPVISTTNIANDVNYGRFIISNVVFNNCDTPNAFTNITVYDAVHGVGISPSTTFPTGTAVSIYFSDDSVSFDQENVFDGSATLPYRRFFEVYVDGNGHTTTHERARFSINTFHPVNLQLYMNMYFVSPKLRGYNGSTFGVNDNEIRLSITSYDQATGLFVGQLGRFMPPSTFTNLGPLTIGQKGQVSRFYDETNIDYIDFIFDSALSVIPTSFANNVIDIQLFPTLELNQQFMLVANCQVDDITKKVSYLTDQRQFGNVSEDQLSTSAIDFINASDKELHENGIIRGFDVESFSNGVVSFSGGDALVNGKIINVNAQTVNIPVIFEALPTTIGGLPTITSVVNVITWFICINEQAEIELVASTDFDPFGIFVSQYQAAALNNLRLFYAMNPNAVSPTPYQIRGTYFAGMVVNQKDVVPIAIAVTTVTGSGSPIVYSISNMVLNDARRYITNGYGGLAEPLTLGTFASFRNIDSLINWLYQLNNLFSASIGTANPISNKVIVKGHVNITTTVPLGYIFGEVFFEGDNGAFDVFIPTGFDIHSNVHFNNLIFNYLYDPVVYSDSSYNALDLINTGKGLIHMGTTNFDRNVSITNCHFIWVPLIANIGGVPPIVPVPPITSTAINRFSFINIELSNPTTPAPTIIQSVDISNNTFIENTLNSFSAINQETTRAAIAIVSLSNTINAPGGGIKLINATIRNNVCDKDQMIAIVPASTVSSNVVSAAINTTGCIIEANTCGTISIFTQYDTPTDINFTANFINFTLDKNNGLIIKDNTCKYITSTDARGVDLVANVTSLLPNTGALTVSDNTCSWIKLPLNINTSAPVATACIIKNNVLNGYDTNFRINYLDGYTPALTNAAIELITIGTSFTNSVIVDSNWISAGIYATITPLTTTFGYDIGIFSQHDIDASNNIVSNLIATLNPLINPIGIQLSTGFSLTASSNIHNNKLFRLSTNWRAYIDSGYGGDHIIVDNFFDNITPDGTFLGLQNQVIGTLSLSNVHDNTNQVISTAIGLIDNKFCYTNFFPATVPIIVPSTGPAASATTVFFDSTNGISLFRYSQSVGSVPTSLYCGIYEFSGIASPITPNVRNLSFTIPLSSQLPAGVKILSAQIGVWVQTFGLATFDTSTPGTGLTQNNAFTLSLVSSQNNYTSGLGSHGITDVKNNISPGFPPISANSFQGGDFSVGPSESFTLFFGTTPSVGAGFQVITVSQAQANTNLITVNTPSDGAGFVTGSTYRISAQFDLNYLRLGGTNVGDSMLLYFSPLLISYRW